jgi:hypothetical protein
MLNVEHLYRTMPSQTPHPETTPVICKIGSLANCLSQHMRGLSGNSQLPTAKRRVSIPAGKSDTSQGGSSVPCTIHGQNYTPSSALNTSCVADITRCVTSTPSATVRQSINSASARPGTSCRCTPAPRGTVQADSTCRDVSSPTSGIARTPTPLGGHDALPIPIPN